MEKINGYLITELPRGWEYRFAADNPNTGHGEKFYTKAAAVSWCEKQ